MRFFIKQIIYLTFFVALLGSGASFAFASVSDGTIDATYHDARLCSGGDCTPGTVVNWKTTNGTVVHITDSGLTGDIWSADLGWIKLNPTGQGVTINTTTGVLSGYAWGSTASWVNFGPFTNSSTAQVTINSSGELNGYAWASGAGGGWIRFSCNTGDADYPNACVKTDWRPLGSRTALVACNNGIDDDGDGYIDYPADHGCSSPTDTDETNPPPPPPPGGGGDPPKICVDFNATNFGGPLPCQYLQNSTCSDHSAINFGGGLPCQYAQVQTCQDHNATNFNGALPCLYTQNSTCQDHLATNFGGALPCQYSPQLCQDNTAVNFGGALPCTYPQKSTCADNTATNFGGALPCQYVQEQTCQDNTATNFGGALPCIYSAQNDQNNNDQNNTDNQNNTSDTGNNSSGSSGSSGGNGGGGNSGGGSSGLVSIIQDGISSFKQVFATTIVGKYIAVLNSVTSLDKLPEKTISKVVAVSGVSVGFVVSLATILSPDPFSLSEIFLIPVRLWSLIVTLLGLRRRPWGTVYDSITKQPLDPVYVTLKDLAGNDVATSITDLDGRYGFLTKAGQYRITAGKTNYVFPSQKLMGRTEDELHADLYFGNVITIAQDGEVLARNIPMDPVSFDWNEFEKNRGHLLKFSTHQSLIVSRIASTVFYIGFALSALALLVTPATYNIVIFGLYLLIFILRMTGLKTKALGMLVEKATGFPLSFAIIRIYSVATKTQIVHRVADKYGRYYCLIGNGTYYATVEKKNADGTYSVIYTSDPITVKKGYLNQSFEI